MRWPYGKARVGATLTPVALAALTLPLLGTTPAAADVAEQRLPSKINALTWNICGGAKSICGGTGTAKEKIAKVMERVADDPSLAVIILTEVCEKAHAGELQRNLKDGWRVNFRAGPVMGGRPGEVNRCSMPGTEDQRAGVLVALKKFRGSQIRAKDENFPGVPYANDKAGRPTQGAACLRDWTYKVMACGSHFPSDGVDEREGTDYDTREACAYRFGALGAKWQAKGWRTVLGGDLNLNAEDERPRLRYLYDWGNFEGDQQNRVTHDGVLSNEKLDYLFFSDRGWRLEGAIVDYSDSVSALSDHWLLKATVQRT
ncbi:endonuclease/exonuclease/phosphatase family protein [Streptomyces lavendofoliae]|uniref:Endonuclease/exonuclease/phosphatase domain-containing protein n=1 Tax=Streptomyces lavendofoliae TaxID=67314 RepID=A0A918I6A2_9ACTN|nr:endonuclease/exonuclease/phosphatase family protein [Streptomyces lavendofoliae]GGU67775.1 hypothetical protein GCM10010274_65240 [Streptomyces lavendofoliae]